MAASCLSLLNTRITGVSLHTCYRYFHYCFEADVLISSILLFCSPQGYAFLLFQEESSVQALIDACLEEDGKLYLCVSSPTIKDKPVSDVYQLLLSQSIYADD